MTPERLPTLMPWRPAGRIGLLLAACMSITVGSVSAQQIPKDDYLTYVPLEYPRIERASAGSERLHLFGDPAASDYVDVDPVDGIDDARGQVLLELGERFAPYLVQNTTQAPMDPRRFVNPSGGWSLFVDTWDLVGDARLVDEARIDLTTIEGEPCPDVGSADSSIDDCRLLALLDEFDPESPTHIRARSGARPAEGDPFKVIYYDFPGYDEASWRAEYTAPGTNTLPEAYRDFVKTLVHPFIHEVRDDSGAPASYELILQYWFFYPSNDGGNNHEGDWEHVAVSVTPMSRVGTRLGAQDIQRMIDGSALEDSSDPLVAGRLEYYIHNHVMELDLSSPNVYAPRSQWETELEGLTEVAGERWMAEHLRRRAWLDDAETIVNTHPLGYIGADNKGTDQLLAMPGGKNRDSHATYPFAGLYKDIGPAGASEEVKSWVDFRAYLNDPESLAKQPFGRGWIQRMDEPGRVEVIPDWERIRPLLRADPAVRKDWSWLILPVRWGYPATHSPFAGVVAHAETGNLSVVGPAYSTSWNRPAHSGGFSPYQPHRFSGFFALGWQDTVLNDWGFLNATIPTLSILPPFDLITRLLFAPVRIVAGRHESTFFHTDRIPNRFVGVVGGVGAEGLPTELTALWLNTPQLGELLFRIGEADPDFGTVRESTYAEDGRSVFGGIKLFVGKNFVSENLLKRVTGELGDRVVFDDGAPPLDVTGTLELWEYVGSMRYNLLIDRIQPYGRAGWGWSWYRVRDVATNGDPLEIADSPWVDTFTWHVGAGVEYLLVQGEGHGFSAIDLGLRGDIVFYRHRLGADQIADPVVLATGKVRPESVTRRQMSLAVTLSY